MLSRVELGSLDRACAYRSTLEASERQRVLIAGPRQIKQIVERSMETGNIPHVPSVPRRDRVLVCAHPGFPVDTAVLDLANAFLGHSCRVQVVNLKATWKMLAKQAIPQ